VNYAISFKTLQKYCQYKRDNLAYPDIQYKYRCRKLEMALKGDLDSICTESNCPLVKHLEEVYDSMAYLGGVNI